MTPEKHPAQADYSTLTDEQIDRLVAERQGYEVRKGKGGYWYTYQHDKLVKPTGKTSEEIARGSLPSWATSIDAAAGLDFDTLVVMIERSPGSTRVWALDPDDEYVQDTLFDVKATTMARAISEAWLRYMDAVEAGT